MNEERDYISVIIKIHDYFKKEEKKLDDYEERILSILREKELSLTELSKEMGYKGITAKLSKTINKMTEEKKVMTVLDINNKPKLSAKEFNRNAERL